MIIKQYRIEFKDWWQYVWARDEESALEIAKEIFYDYLEIEPTGESRNEFED